MAGWAYVDLNHGPLPYQHWLQPDHGAACARSQRANGAQLAGYELALLSLLLSGPARRLFASLIARLAHRGHNQGDDRKN